MKLFLQGIAYGERPTILITAYIAVSREVEVGVQGRDLEIRTKQRAPRTAACWFALGDSRTTH